MSTALQAVSKNEISYTPEQIALIKNTIAKNATDDEFKLFMYRCKNMQLDPLKPGQIHFVKYGNGPGTVVVGIDGFRSTAGRTGKLSGVERGVKRDEKGKITHGWAKVYRKDWEVPAYEESPLSEYDTGFNNWKKMPETMIKKVAECAALRMAFPDDLGGVYAPEEMEQATSQGNAAEKGFPTGITPAAMGQPTEEDGIIDDGKYRIPFGKFQKKAIEEVDTKELANYVDYLETSAKKKNQPLSPTVKDFISRVDSYLAAMENGNSDSDV